MPVISDKALAMPASPIRKLVPFAEAAKKKGVHVHHLNIGQPDIKTPDNVLAKLANIGRTVIEYSHSAGFQSYREGLVKYYSNWGINLTPDDIIVTTGASEALLFGFQSCFNPGDELIVPEPFYANYNSFALSADVKLVPVTAKIETGFALPPISDFEKLITDRTKGILICNPGNPTGYVYTDEELEKLREIVLKHDLFLFADEVYREFCYDGKTPKSTMRLSGLDQNVIMVDSVSKRYSMCGARVGAIVTKNKEVIANAMKFAQARLSPPTVGQIAGEEALNTPKQYFDDVLAEYTERRDTLISGLNSIEGVICPNPGGAFYAIAELPVKNAEDFCQWILESFSHNNSTVMMAPAEGFYATKGEGKNQVRLAYVLKNEDLKDAIEVLRAALKVYPN
jgi:aspartate aminotransferase